MIRVAIRNKPTSIFLQILMDNFLSDNRRTGDLSEGSDVLRSRQNDLI